MRYGADMATTPDAAPEPTPDRDIAERVTGAVVAAGWYDGDGAATDPRAVADATRLLTQLVARGLPLPWVYPTLEGGIQAEWEIGARRASVDVQPDGEVYCFSTVLGEPSFATDHTCATSDTDAIAACLLGEGGEHDEYRPVGDSIPS